MYVVRKESKRVFSKCLGDGSAGKSTWYTNMNAVQISGTHMKKIDMDNYYCSPQHSAGWRLWIKEDFWPSAQF